MHCEDLTCAEVCRRRDQAERRGIAAAETRVPRELRAACPFGVPMLELEQMMKCDMLTTSSICASCVSVCPSQALWFGPRRRSPPSAAAS
jgi:Fe-S-cluster-containing dehydrogenase component